MQETQAKGDQEDDIKLKRSTQQRKRQSEQKFIDSEKALRNCMSQQGRNPSAWNSTTNPNSLVLKMGNRPFYRHTKVKPH